MDVSPPAQANVETRSIFAIREAFHPTARPKHRMHIRFSGPQTDGPPLDRRMLYPTAPRAHTAIQTSVRRGALCGQKHRGFLAGAISNGPRGRPFAAKAGAPKIARPRRGRRPARLSFYTERRGLSIPPTGISVPECGKSAGPSPSCPFSAPYALNSRARKKRKPRTPGGDATFSSFGPRLREKREGEGEKALSLPASRRPARRRGGVIPPRAQTRPSARRRADRSSRPAGRQRARPPPPRHTHNCRFGKLTSFSVLLLLIYFSSPQGYAALRAASSRAMLRQSR